MLLEVLTPDKLLYKGQVNLVNLPGESGRFGIMDNHAPLITVLAAGVVEVEQTGDTKAEKERSGDLASSAAMDKRFTFEVNGGVVEVLKNKVIVLAE